MKTLVVVSGGFDPLHIGHIEMINKAKELGDELVVIVNSDKFLNDKKGYVFMPLSERVCIMSNLKNVDMVIKAIDKDNTVCDTLELIYRLSNNKYHIIFANGGDRGVGNVPEEDVCHRLGINMVYGLGKKIQSSSELVGAINKDIK